NSCAVSTDTKRPSARRVPITDRWAKFVGNFWVRKSALGVAIALSAVGLAATASSDPNEFSNLSCSCQSPPDLGPAGPDQIVQGIRDGLAYPQAAQRPTAT